MPSEWAYAIARDQRRDVETMATNLDAARSQGRREGLEEAAKSIEDGPLRGRLPDGDLFWRGPQNFADDIRALIAQEPTA